MTSTPRAIVADAFAPRMALFYAGIFLAAGVQLPFFPAWLAAMGLDPRSIGLVLAAPVVTRILVVPVVTRISDRLGAPRGMLIAASTAAALGFVAVALAEGFAAILAAVTLASIALAPIMALADSYALKGLRLRRRAYGPVRLWGSVAFIAANLVGGLLLGAIARVNLVWLIVAGYAAMASAALALVPLGDVTPRIGPAPPADRPYRLPAVLAITAAASLIQASHAVYYGFSTLEWAGKGFDGAAIGALWALGVVAEIGLFAVSARLPSALGPIGLIGLGAAGGVIRWAVMGFDPPAALLPALQCLHGLSFGATHLGAVQFLARIAPERGAAAQGDFSTIQGVTMAVSTGLSGALYGAFGGRAYLAMALLAATGGALAILASRPGRRP